jgi:pimeloyl-ACP methyl ester carboxylesterase
VAFRAEPLEIEAGGFTFRGIGSGPSDGSPVVLLHGFPQTSFSWNHQLEALGKAGYRAVAFDQRGYSPGARPPDVADYKVANLVADVVGVADSLGFGRFDVVGHDWGGMVAWALASAHPDRLRSVTVLSTPHPHAFGAALADPEGEQQKKSSYIEVFRQEGVAENVLLGDEKDGQGLRVMFAASGLDSEEIEEFVRAMTEPGALTAALNWYRATDFESMSEVGPIEIPTMYIWSTEDIALGREAAEATAGFVEGPYRFEVLEGISHWIPEMAPDQVNSLLIGFLGSRDA